MLLKLKLISEYPLIFTFMLRILNEEDEEIKNSLNDSREEFVETFKSRVYAGLGQSLKECNEYLDLFKRVFYR